MSIEVFEATVREAAPLAVIRLHGDINGNAESALNAAYGEATALDPEGIVLNFEQVGYINSTGIALIVSILARARQEGIPLLTCRLSDHYREIFEITRLIDFVTVVPDEAAAMRAIAS